MAKQERGGLGPAPGCAESWVVQPDTYRSVGHEKEHGSKNGESLLGDSQKGIPESLAEGVTGKIHSAVTT